MNYNLAFIGFGNIGQGFAELLLEQEKQLKEKYGIEYKVVAISTLTRGTVYNKNGLNLKEILKLIKKGEPLTNHCDVKKGWDALKTIKDSNADIVLELTPTNIKTGEPAITHIKTALLCKKNVITVNKGPIALKYKQLMTIAQKNKVMLKFEGTVLGGTPAITLGTEALAGAKITEIKGILNGTTNFILTEMEKGKEYQSALKEAQRLGYAETDPTADVEGYDTVAKLVILANVLMDVNIKPSDVKRTGITKISLANIKKARQNGQVWKLVGHIKTDNGIKAEVAPKMLKSNELLANINKGMNGLCIKTDIVGEITIIGAGAGPKGTSFAILNDLISINRTLKGINI
ncbi:MAG: homoserine dehydrogenase [bacterium]|nr:homoserine dehydrogenase [bacterium]